MLRLQRARGSAQCHEGIGSPRLTRSETSYGVVLDVETVKLHSVL